MMMTPFRSLGVHNAIWDVSGYRAKSLGFGFPDDEFLMTDGKYPVRLQLPRLAPLPTE